MRLAASSDPCVRATMQSAVTAIDPFSFGERDMCVEFVRALAAGVLTCTRTGGYVPERVPHGHSKLHSGNDAHCDIVYEPEGLVIGAEYSWWCISANLHCLDSLQMAVFTHGQRSVALPKPVGRAYTTQRTTYLQVNAGKVCLWITVCCFFFRCPMSAC